MYSSNIINVNIHIADQDIDDIMCTALEGGITYWCYRCKVIGDYLGEYASDQISRDGELEIFVDEDDETYIMTKEKFLNGVRLALENGFKICDENEIDASMVDAELADVIVQYALFGEIIYG